MKLEDIENARNPIFHNKYETLLYKCDRSLRTRTDGSTYRRCPCRLSHLSDDCEHFEQCVAERIHVMCYGYINQRPKQLELELEF